MRQTDAINLKYCLLFRNISDANLNDILDNTQYKFISINKHDIYCYAGDACRHADIMLSGEMVARMTGLSGRQVEVIRIKQGDLIAPCFIYSSINTLPVEIECIENSLLMRMSIDTFTDIINNNTDVCHNFLRIVSDTGAYLATKIEFLSLMTIREKVVYFLRSEIKTQHSLKLTLDISRQRMANSFAIQKFSLMRCLAELANKNIIKINGKEIEIIDIKRLK